jgi:hypothetical protein
MVVAVAGGAGPGMLCRLGTLEQVGGYAGAWSPAAKALRVSPGHTGLLSFVVGTASVGGDRHVSVPQGTYDLVVPVDLHRLLERPGIGEDNRYSVLALGGVVSIV